MSEEAKQILNDELASSIDKMKCPECEGSVIIYKEGTDVFLDYAHSIYCENCKMIYSLMAYHILTENKKEATSDDSARPFPTYTFKSGRDPIIVLAFGVVFYLIFIFILETIK
jgi:hypothetical protein